MPSDEKKVDEESSFDGDSQHSFCEIILLVILDSRWTGVQDMRSGSSFCRSLVRKLSTELRGIVADKSDASGLFLTFLLQTGRRILGAHVLSFRKFRIPQAADHS